MSDKEREAFEAHIRSTWKVPADYLDWALKPDKTGGYLDSRASDQWSGWAARAAQAEPATAGPVPSEQVLLDLIERYWDIAYAEGQRGATTDNPDGDANRTLYEIRKAIDALAASQAPAAPQAAQPVAPAALTYAQVIDIRDAHLPSQGESFNWLAFGRAIIAAAAPKAEGQPATGEQG